MSKKYKAVISVNLEYEIIANSLEDAKNITEGDIDLPISGVDSFGNKYSYKGNSAKVLSIKEIKNND